MASPTDTSRSSRGLPLRATFLDAVVSGVVSGVGEVSDEEVAPYAGW